MCEGSMMDAGTDMEMSMVMTFQPWSSYQVTILWDWWRVETKLQYALSWFVLMAATVCFHAIRYFLFKLEEHMSKTFHADSQEMLTDSTSTSPETAVASSEGTLLKRKLLLGKGNGKAVGKSNTAFVALSSTYGLLGTTDFDGSVLTDGDIESGENKRANGMVELPSLPSAQHMERRSSAALYAGKKSASDIKGSRLSNSDYQPTIAYDEGKSGQESCCGGDKVDSLYFPNTSFVGVRSNITTSESFSDSVKQHFTETTTATSPQPQHRSDHAISGGIGNSSSSTGSSTAKCAFAFFYRNAARVLTLSRYLLLLRCIHAACAGVAYLIASLLMLVAMTYNPGLLMAIVTGYTVGDFIFYKRTRRYEEIKDCH